MALHRDVRITYLGHATFLFRTPGGRFLLIDPWVETNPVCPEQAKKLPGLDTVLITHGHSDHLGDTVSLAKRFKPRIGCIFEIALWLGGQGVENVIGLNKGGTVHLNDIRATMVNAFHSSSIEQPDGSLAYGGEASGWIVEFENGFKIYHAGDTCLFGDMAWIGRKYRPEVAFLPIGDLYTMDPEQAAEACRLLEVPYVVPMHYGTFPALTGRPETLVELLKGSSTQVIILRPGESIE
ncbi:MAG TPA: metal-dependent hydrolase [Acidobacteriota bacterium]|nr:metal-dependent hydrolase [Acidobacteriota bacterium]HRR25657.1 metal-dependent hydrolase [Acidobacteriota bacterium]HRR56070.1 metal-dependent hydrolase [Acidobacteriota bacterium]HRV06845.1 metal-dependent hydrolase [Acidobacteriota bacterium]